MARAVAPPVRQRRVRAGAARPEAGAPRSASGVVLRTLTEEEREARARALVDARGREEEERRRAEIDARGPVDREAREQIEREAAEARKREEDARRAQEAEAKRRSEEEAKRRLGGEPGARRAAPAASRPTRPACRPAGRRGAVAAAAHRGRREKRIIRRPGAADQGRPAAQADARQRAEEPRPPDRRERHGGGGGAHPLGRGVPPPRAAPEGPRRRRSRRRSCRARSILPETITIQELANRMSERAVDVIKLLMKQGQMAVITDVIDADTAELIAVGARPHASAASPSPTSRRACSTTPDTDEHLMPRPPVVTIMGHVDHGKTSLLDAIRSANVVSGEAGGITQHIGAYQVDAPDGAPITFIDTPGHAAFTAMRARGAKVTDIVVLVVAADDGVMPQTVEAIAHAKAAERADDRGDQQDRQAGRQPERVRTELLQYEVQVESMGGETLEVEVSATKKINLDKLLEAIALQAELLDLQRQSRPAGRGHRHRGAARPRPRSGGDRAGAARHAAGRRHRSSPGRSGAACARCSTTRARPSTVAGPSVPGRGAGLLRRAGCRRPHGGGGERGAGARDHRLPRAPEAREGRRRAAAPRAARSPT